MYPVCSGPSTCYAQNIDYSWIDPNWVGQFLYYIGRGQKYNKPRAIHDSCRLYFPFFEKRFKYVSILIPLGQYKLKKKYQQAVKIVQLNLQKEHYEFFLNRSAQTLLKIKNHLGMWIFQFFRNMSILVG